MSTDYGTLSSSSSRPIQGLSYTLLPCKHKAEQATIFQITRIALETGNIGGLINFSCPLCHRKVTIVEFQSNGSPYSRDNRIIIATCLSDGTPLTEAEAEQWQKIQVQRSILKTHQTGGMYFKDENIYTGGSTQEQTVYIIRPQSRNIGFTFATTNCANLMDRKIQKIQQAPDPNCCPLV